MQHNDTFRLSREFKYKSHSIAYDVIGDGPPLILIHGTPFSSYVWRNILPKLSSHFTVYLFDLLGYGQSDKIAGNDVSLGVQNDVLAALIEYWGLTAPDAIAHDFGGATALRAHFINKCDYRKLFLFDVVALRPWGSPFVGHVANHQAAFEGVPPYIQEAIVSAYIRGAIHREMTDNEIEPYVRQWMGTKGQPAFYQQIAQMDQKYTQEVESQFGQVRCPTMLLWGDKDAWLPIEQGRELAAILPGCAYKEIGNSGHLMQEDAPDEIVSNALSFFSS